MSLESAANAVLNRVRLNQNPPHEVYNTQGYGRRSVSDFSE